MPFLVSTSRKPGAVLGMARGRFLGGDTEYVIMNRLNSVALYSLDSTSQDETATDIPTHRVQLLREFPLFASIKYVAAVSLVNPDTGEFLRDVLFLLSLKQELAILAFSCVATSRPDAEAQPAIEAVTLYHGAVDGCLYQYFPGEAHLVCATPHLQPQRRNYGAVAHASEAARRDVPGGASPFSHLTPFVVLGVNRGELYVLDVLAALGRYTERRPRNSTGAAGVAEDAARRAVFPEALWSAAARRATGSCVSKCALHSSEYEVRDVVFLPVAPPKTGGAALHPAFGSSPSATLTPSAPCEVMSMMLLFADIHGRTHVSLYSLASSPMEASPTVMPKARAAGQTAAPFQFLEGVLGGYDERLTRKGLVVSNCDPTAAKLLTLRDCTVLIGSLLVTTFQHPSGSLTAGAPSAAAPSAANVMGAGSAASAAPGMLSPVTTELPAGLELACACVALDDHHGSHHDGPAARGDAVATAFFKDGTVVSVGAPRGPHHQDGAPAGGGLRRLNYRIGVIPSDATPLSASLFLIGSRFDNTVLVDVASHREATVVENAGPVLDLTVMRDTASCPTVVAATGVGKNGGVTFVRSAATVAQHGSCSLWPLQANRVLQARNLVVITSEYGSRFFRVSSEAGDAPGAAPAFAEVIFDATLSDANVQLLRAAPSQRPASDRYHILDSTGRVHVVELLPRDPNRASPNLSAAAWELARDLAAEGSVGMAVIVVAADATSASLEAFAVSDGSNIAVYASVLNAGTTAPLLAMTVGAPVACMSLVQVEGRLALLIGDWRSHLHFTELPCPASSSQVGIGAHAGARAATVHTRVNLAAVPTSIAAVAVSTPQHVGRVTNDSRDYRVFVGLMNGHCQEVSLPMLLSGRVRDVRGSENDKAGPSSDPLHVVAESVVSPPMFLMRTPIDFSPVAGGSLLCRGPTPLLMVLSPPPQQQLHLSASADPADEWKCGVELTGLNLSGVLDFCACLTSHDRPEGPRLVFLTNYNGCHILSLCSMPSTAQKTNHTFLKMGCTVTQVRYVRAWEKFALALRHSDTDVIAFLPADVLDAVWKAPLLPSNSFSLLENERCVFVEPLALGGDNCRNPKELSGDEGDAECVVLVGSTFAFPDEQRPRSSLITWYRRTQDNRPTEKVSKDIGGQLQCCCPVPNYPGRIALGVSGCVLLFAWNSAENTFVAEERLRVGMMITKLIPIFDSAMDRGEDEEKEEENEEYHHRAGGAAGERGSAARGPSCLVALDSRYSAVFLAVNPVQGGLEVAARDKQLRGIMDGDIMHTPHGSRAAAAQDLCVVDENMNFLCFERPTAGRLRPWPPAAGEAGTDAVPSPGTQAAAARPGASGPAGATRSAPGAAGGEAPGNGLIRLAPSAQSHLGDLVTVLQRGSLALVTANQDSLPSPQALLPGLDSEQLVYGTTHGALGVVSSIGQPTFIFLKSLEAALLTTGATPTGGFAYADFRATSVVGQERSLNRALTLAHTGDRDKTSAKAESGVCSGDIVDTYLRMERGTARAAVLRRAGALILAGATKLRAHPTGAPLEATQDSSPTPEEQIARDGCNAILALERLPTLPLTHSSVEAFLLNLRRTH